MTRHFTTYLSVLLLGLIAASTASLTCYTGADNSVSTVTIDEPNLICIRYDFTCSPTDGACTPDEGANKVIKTAYAVATQDLCNEMRARPTMYRNVFCCSTDKCNAPLDGSSLATHVTPVIGLFSLLFLLLVL